MHCYHGSSGAYKNAEHAPAAGRAAAAAGQTGLMALYDSLFRMMDMTAAQLLVTAVSARRPPRSLRFMRRLGRRVGLLFGFSEPASARPGHQHDVSRSKAR